MTKSFIASTAALVVALAFGNAGQAAAEESGRTSPTFDELLAAELGTRGGLTSDEVAARALVTSPAVKGKKEELLAAAAEVDRAAYGYVPTLQLSASYTRLSDTSAGSAGSVVSAPGTAAGPIPPGSTLVSVPLSFETPLDQYAFQASVLVPLSDYFTRVGPTKAGAEFGEAAAREQVVAERLRAAADARIVYYSWVRARLGLIVAEQGLFQANAHLGDAKIGLQAGSVSRADVLRIESEVARSELLVTSSRHLSTLTEEQVRTAMHDPSGRSFRIGEDVRRSLEFADNVPLASLYDEALRNRPELKALAAERGARERTTAVDRASYGPRLELFGNAAYANPNSRVFPAEEEFRGSWEAGAQLVWRISDIPATAARVRGDEARARAVEAERASLADRIRIDVISAYQARVEARVSEDTSARGLAAAEESYRTRRLLFQNGRATTVELLDAETDLTRARLEAVGARIDSRVAEVRLAYALGRESRLASGAVGR